MTAAVSLDPRRPDGTLGLLIHPTLTPSGSMLRPILSLGWQVAAWVEHMLCHGPGDLAEQPIQLDAERRLFVVLCYAVGPDGRRLVEEATISRLKGWAKSELAGALVVAEAVGPVRFDHWAKPGEVSSWGYRYEPGEPVGAPIRYPLVKCMATEENQAAANTYEAAMVMMRAGRIAREVPGIDVGITRTFVPGGGEIRPVTASSASKDGGKETFGVADETHLYVPGELGRTHAVLSRNLTKRPIAEPWMLNTTTMHEPGRQSVGEQNHRAALKGKLPAAQLYDWRCGPLPADWDDDEQLAEAIRAAAGEAASWIDVRRKISNARDPKSTRADSERYHLNREPGKATDGMFDAAGWDVLERRGERLVEGDVVALGFDGSVSSDETWLVACRWPDWLLVPLRRWVRPEGARDWRVPRAEVMDEVEIAFSRYNVVRFHGDPAYWRPEFGIWTATFGEGPEGKKRVWEVPWSSDSRAVPITERFVTMVGASQVGHDGDVALRSHVLAAVKEPCRSGGYRPGKRSDAAADRIDGLVAAELAVDGLAMALARGELDDIAGDMSDAVL